MTMCGRYVLFSDTEIQDIRDIIDEVQRKVNGEIKTGEIFPTDKAPVLIQEQGIITPDAVKWGFPNFHNKGVIINSRAEQRWKNRCSGAVLRLSAVSFHRPDFTSGLMTEKR